MQSTRFKPAKSRPAIYINYGKGGRSFSVENSGKPGEESPKLIRALKAAERAFFNVYLVGVNTSE